MPGVEDEQITGTLVDIDAHKGTMTIECEGDYYVVAWTSDVEEEIGEEVTVHEEDVLN